MAGSTGVVKSSVLMLIANIVAFAGGAVYWFLLARVVGLKALGLGTGIVSAVGIASTLLGGGFGLALARLVAERGKEAPCAALASLALSAAAATLSSLLSAMLGEPGAAWWGFSLGFIATLSALSVQLLVGLGRFGLLAVAHAAGNAAKVAVGLALGLAGYGVAAVLSGYLLHQLAVALAAFAAAGTACGLGSAYSLLRRVAALGASNTVYVAGNQLVQSLGVYVYAVVTGDHASTGLLYIGAMLAVVAAMPAGSLAAAALHHSVREGRELAISSAPLGLLASSAAAAALAALTPLALALIGAGTGGGSVTAIRVLAVSGPLLGLLNIVVSELNRRSDSRGIGLVAASRLLLLLVLFPPLAARFGLLGAAVAFLASSAAAVLAAGTVDRRVPALAARALAASLPGLLSPNGVLAAVLSAPVVVAASMLLGHLLLYPVPDGLRLVVASVLRPRGRGGED